MSDQNFIVRHYTREQIMRAALSLFDGPVDCATSEYARGVCELIGRLELDYGGVGEGTGENAYIVETELTQTRMDLTQS